MGCGNHVRGVVCRTMSRRAFVRGALAMVAGWGVACARREVTRPTEQVDVDKLQVFFGDLHLHTVREHQVDSFTAAFSADKLRETYDRAKDAGHSFLAIANHSELLTDEMWQQSLAVCSERDDAGKFVTLPAFEWTASKFCARYKVPKPRDWWKRPGFGHRNVYYKTDGPVLRCCDDGCDTPGELFRALSGYDSIVIPHHPGDEQHPFAWDTFSPGSDLLVEMCQQRGSYEEHIEQFGLAKGLQFGLVAGSDNHEGKPGEPRGITAILATELSRTALFEALRARRVYATDSGDILLKFSCQGIQQGGVVRGSTLDFRLEVDSLSQQVANVQVVRNGEIHLGWEPQSLSFRTEWSDKLERAQARYYVRVVLANQHRAWSSPIFVRA